MVAKESLFLLHHYPTSLFLNLVPLMLQEPQTQCPADTVAEMKSGFHNNRPWLTLGQSESTSTSHPNSIWGFVFCSFIALFHCTPTLGLAVFPRCSGGQIVTCNPVTENPFQVTILWGSILPATWELPVHA